MYKQLLEDISYDLKINQYPGEDEKQYQTRVIYSAISLWMKYIILDHMIHEDETEIKSKNYHYRRTSEVLEEYINLFPEIVSWMKPYDTIDPIHVIRNRLIAAGEINEVDLDGNISLAQKKTVPINGTVSRLIDISSENTQFKYVGITKLIDKRNKNDLSLTVENSLDLVKNFINPSFYTEISEVNFEYEVFNSYRKNKSEKHWILNGKLDGKINLIRKRTNIVNYRKYLLVLNHSDKILQYPLKAELIKQGFHTRLMLGIRQFYENPAMAQYEKHTDIVELKLDINLPRYEESFLTTYAWPRNHILDKWSFIVPLELWGTVSAILETLGYKLEEV